MKIWNTSRKENCLKEGNFYVGVDLGQKHDPSVIIVVRKDADYGLHVVHKRVFPLGTPYSEVLGYLNLLNKSLNKVHRILIDQTGVGEVFVEDAQKSGLKNAEGVNLSLTRKQEIMTCLKQVMEKKRLHLPFDRELINEMNNERYEVMKTGHYRFSHPSGTHDDSLWALALAVYTSRPEVPEYHPVVLTGYIIKPKISIANLGLEKKTWLRDPLYNQTARLCMACGVRRPLDMVVCPKCGAHS